MIIDKNKKYYMFCENKEEQEIINDTFENLCNFNNKWLSMSCVYETIEELHKGEEMLEEKCKICGKIVTANYMEPIRTEIINKNICFSCNLWSERINNINNSNVYIINHEYYSDAGRTNELHKFLGHGGQLFHIKKFNSKEIITTNNLWFGGEIPKVFWDKIPDNSEFVKTTGEIIGEYLFNINS